MEIEQLLKNVQIPKGNIKYNEPMNKHTTFKIGGPAECFIKINNIEELKEILKIAKENNIQITIIGNGSHILVLDNGIKEKTLNIKLEGIHIQEKGSKIEIKIGAGEKIRKIAQICLEEQITGMEELAGIPGTIGGAVKMNAGAHNKEIKDIVKNVKCIDYNGNERNIKKEQLEFGYRTSIFKNNKYIITEITIELQKGKQEEIKQKMEKYISYRKEKQPIEYPSAGSAFKRGDNFITAQLIEQAGLKGFSIGDAEISNKHSGFIINKGNATAKDVIQLIEHIKKTVYEKFNKNIELEIEIIGENNI